MTQTKKINSQIEELKKEIEEYFNKNPRENHPKILNDFVEYAKNFYKDRDNVNWTYSDDKGEQLEEVEDYVNDSSEIILLAKLSTLQEAQKMFLEEIDKIDRELNEEQERIEDEMISCNCNQGINIELNKCHIHDCLYAKHEGIRFIGEKLGELKQRFIGDRE